MVPEKKRNNLRSRAEIILYKKTMGENYYRNASWTTHDSHFCTAYRTLHIDILLFCETFEKEEETQRCILQ